MKRESSLYKFRRKMQCFATKVAGYSLMTKVYYKVILGEKCNLDEPRTFNEKLCWLKVNDYPQNALVIKCTDKYRVREYVKEKIGEEYLVPLINHWNTPDKIDFSQLPSKFILKCNHGCGYNILVDDVKEVDEKEIKAELKRWMKEDFSLFNAEPHYHFIKREVICEEHLGKDLVDYKFFCFNGKPEFFYVSAGLLDNDTAVMKHYNIDGTPAPFQRGAYREKDFDLDERLSQMVELAKKLSQDFKFVRVDLVVAQGKIWFSELTFTPGGGYNNLEPRKYLVELGDKLSIK